jgi:hypothetical protein
MLQFAGFWMAVATFLGIWWGHVGVRWIEAHSPRIWVPIALFIAGGFTLNIYSLFAPNLTISGVASIIGITFFWDAFEVYRQQNRIKHGHAPANPDNPRHAAILAAGMGTTEDLLDREPQGYPVVPQEARATDVKPVAVGRTHAYEETEEAYEEVRV